MVSHGVYKRIFKLPGAWHHKRPQKMWMFFFLNYLEHLAQHEYTNMYNIRTNDLVENIDDVTFLDPTQFSPCT